MSTSLERIEAWQDATAAGRELSLREGMVLAVREGADPVGSRYTYGARGELTRIDEPNGTRWEYAYAPDGRLLSVSRGGAPHAAFRYDAAGRLAEAQGPLGTRRHAYDERGRLVRTLRGDAGASAWRYGADGRVQSARGDHEETRFAYDGAGRVTAIEQEMDGVVLAAAFDFDAEGRLEGTRFPAWGLTLAFGWDERGRPASLAWTKDGDADARTLARFGYGEDAEGRIAWRETADGAREESWHDPADGRVLRRLLRRGGDVLREQRLDYGVGWRITREGERTYAYDALGRLITAEEGDRRWRWTWDAMDDLVDEDGPSPRPQRVETDGAGRVRRALQDGIETVYRYDAAGELTDVLRNGTRLARFRYDHKGRLLARTGPAGTERYLYGADDALLAVAGEDGAPRRIFLRLPTGQVGMLDFARGAGGEPVFFHHDGRGNLAYAGWGDGRMEGPFAADPFGLPLDAPASSVYTHRERAWHGDIGLYRMGCRWYAPALRRFLTPDSYTGAPDDERLVNPFVPAGGQRAARAQILGEWLKQPRVRNRHAYCGNDPVNRFDPNGHWSFGGVLLSLLGAVWTLPNTLFGLAVEITCLVGEVVRWLVWLCSGGNVSWQTPGFDAAASGRLNAFALVFTGGWLGSFNSLLGITFGNVFFINRDWKTLSARWQAMPAQVQPPAYAGTSITIPRDDVLYEHELRHVNQYGWFGPFFHLGLPLWGFYEWDVILHGYDHAWTEENAEHWSGF
ncbi:MAG TPA: RHS repeat-associated core domain-containing protein [Longimicrobium sp.]